MPQDIVRYVRSADGTRIAWTEGGSGSQTLVWAANHITDIQYDPKFSNRWDQIERLQARFRVVRYDHRGCGSSQRNVLRQGQEAWVEDLTAVIDAASPNRPVVLAAPSQSSLYGATFAARHPERLSHLVLQGAYACGALANGSAEGAARVGATLELIRLNWDSVNPQTRMMVATGFFPEPTANELAWVARLPQVISSEDALRFFKADAEQDAGHNLAKIKTPTLVMASAEDPVILPEWTRVVAASVPGARYVEFPGKNHIPLLRDGSFQAHFDHLLAFTQSGRPDRLAGLSDRERDILAGVCAGLSNEAIALQRSISEKTVRNHLTRIFDKMRVRSRTQAVLAATGADSASV
jgi:pimeloyl-ACP methyl ester carboxylesterase